MRDKFDRLNWDDWFLSICHIVSQRSIDPATKHGCVVVAQDKTILAVGYNGPPRDCDDDVVPLTRPEKYVWMQHSEENAIGNAARHGVKLLDSIFYITGHPCEKCFAKIKSVGAKKIIYGNTKSACVTQESKDIIAKMNTGRNVEMIHKDVDLTEIFNKIIATNGSNNAN